MRRPTVGQAGGDDLRNGARCLALLGGVDEGVRPNVSCGRTKVSGPGQNFFARRSAASGQFATSDCAISMEATWTMRGLVAGLRLTA